MQNNSLVCGVCHNDKANTPYTITEAMFGTKEAFSYFECAACGCMQIVEVPADLARHYGEGYYSMNAPAQSPSGPLKMAFKRIRLRYWITNTGSLGKLLADRAIVPPPWWRNWFSHIQVGFNDPILDIGSGSGDLIFNMADHGFTNLTGIDPFIESDSNYGQVRLLKRFPKDMTGSFALVMMHHAYEHVPDPIETMQSVYRLLQPGGVALIRIPVMGKYAWRTYGVHWAQLDAPRHLFIYSEKSMQILAENAGLKVEKIVYDSADFQFWASELNVAGKRWDCKATHFTPEQLRGMEVKAAELNKNNDGDQASFFLRRPK